MVGASRTYEAMQSEWTPPNVRVSLPKLDQALDFFSLIFGHIRTEYTLKKPAII